MLMNPVFLACYEGEDTAAADAAAQAAAEAAAAAAAKGATKPPPLPTFNQEQVNKMLAEDRRKSEAKYKAALAEQATSLEQLLATKTLTEQEKTAAEEKLEKVQSQLLSEKQQIEKKLNETKSQMSAQLKEQEAKAKDWETRYAQTEIKRELQDAAVKGDAFNAAQLVMVLKPMTKMVEVNGESKPMVEMEEVVDGKLTTVQYSPEDAVKKMKSLPDLYGNLFKTGVKSGLGGTTTGDITGAGGAIDWKNLTQAQYEAQRGKHPDLPAGRSAKK
jgi:pyruvate/2-oxoglutarate dehydrogenase complex dihydrolipoamide acyltransferase (E2) component